MIGNPKRWTISAFVARWNIAPLTFGYQADTTRSLDAEPWTFRAVSDLRPPVMRRFAQKRMLTYKPSAERNSGAHRTLGQEHSDPDAEYEHNWESEIRYNQPHPIWNEQDVKGVKKTHHEPRQIGDFVALTLIRILRNAFDIGSGYKFWVLSPQGWLNRIIILETVAGVPGLVGAGYRHLRSLRRMRRDYGWIHTLLEEAENERMHLMTALLIKQPGIIFRFFVVAGQVFFFPLFTTMYAVSPKTAHRFVGYLEEEAVRTYTHLIGELESGKLEDLRLMKAPKLARAYWQLKDDATFQDMIYAIRADESHHRDVNHTFADMRPDEENPFLPPGQH